MLQSDLSNFLFLDIETVPMAYKFEELPDKWKHLFAKKVRYRVSEDNPVEQVYEQAGIWAEFGKVVAVSFGKFKRENGKRRFYVKSLASKDEPALLKEVKTVLNKFYQKGQNRFLCAHNGKEFDFPFLARRMLINGTGLPEILKMHGMKPWETPYCDTMELWSFGDRKHYTSLELLCELLGIPGSKSDMDGSDVARVFYEENNLEKIKNYCNNDVIALANLFLKFREEETLKDNEIEIL